MKPPKSQLTQREENEAKAARKANKQKTQKKAVFKSRPASKPSAPKPVVPKPQKTETQSEEEVEDRQDAELYPRAQRSAAAKVKRDSEKAEKEREIAALQARGFKKPAPYTLQLPPLPARQNTSGRDFRLNTDPSDDTFPLDHEMREAAVSTLMDAMRDSRVAQDKVALTTNFWHTWLKLGVEGKYPYEKIDMERVCRKLVNIAEALHEHGMGATDIYCRRTIDRACAAPAMKFGVRIDKLAKLMRGTKARCNEFMLGNTLEDTVALIDTKIADLKSNGANNHMRSVKVKEYNKRLGFKMREKWPKDENGDPLPYEGLGKVPFEELDEDPYGTPESMMSPEGMKDEDDELADAGEMHYKEHLKQAQVGDPDSAQDPRGFDMDSLLAPTFNSPLPATHGFSDQGIGSFHGHGPDVGMHPGFFQQPSTTFQQAAPMLETQMEPSHNGYGNQLSAYGSRGDNNIGGHGEQHPVAPVATPHAVNHYTYVDPNLTGFNMNAMLGGNHGQPMHMPNQHQSPFAAHGEEYGGNAETAIEHPRFSGPDVEDMTTW